MNEENQDELIKVGDLRDDSIWGLYTIVDLDIEKKLMSYFFLSDPGTIHVSFLNSRLGFDSLISRSQTK